MTPSNLIDVIVSSIAHETPAVRVYELRMPDGAALPSFTAGSHIDVHLPQGLVRAYSLCNPQNESDKYLIAVAHSQNGRGGSTYIHSNLKIGDILKICPPRNNFPLYEDAPHTVFIAGGIGITPILCMAHRLEALGRSWELVYCARTRASAAFVELLSRFKVKVSFVFDGEPGQKMLDMRAFAASVPKDAHLYCCGPQPMMDAFTAATVDRLATTVHLEYFTAKDAPATGGGFTVKLFRSSREVQIQSEKSILDTLLEMDVPVQYSCLEGTCGECLTTVLAGTPDHRDVFLSKADHDANNKMTICCSGSKTSVLVLDL